MRSLVIEDEPQIGAYLGRLLAQLRGIVDIVGSLSDAKQALGNFKYDLASSTGCCLTATPSISSWR